jgi:hypothetical protein
VYGHACDACVRRWSWSTRWRCCDPSWRRCWSCNETRATSQLMGVIGCANARDAVRQPVPSMRRRRQRRRALLTISRCSARCRHAVCAHRAYCVDECAMTQLMRELFDDTREQLMERRDFQQFVRRSGEWLAPYALFCAVRDRCAPRAAARCLWRVPCCDLCADDDVCYAHSQCDRSPSLASRVAQRDERRRIAAH